MLTHHGSSGLVGTDEAIDCEVGDEIPTVCLEEDLVNIFVYHGVRGPGTATKSEQVFQLTRRTR